MEEKNYLPEFVEFDYLSPKKKLFIKGELYSFINEHNLLEFGECVDYNERTGRVKLKKIRKRNN